MGGPNLKFSMQIKHFAADVSYTVDGFLEKNKDTVNEQLLAVVAATKVRGMEDGCSL